MRHGTPISRRFAAIIMAALLFISAVPASAMDRTPNDPYFSDQWYLKRIGATEAWNKSLGFEGITVAVIDSGVDIRHPDLKDNIWTNAKEIPGNGIDDDLNGYIDDVHGWDFVDEDNDPTSETSDGYDVLGANHGTISAGIIGARGDNGVGITGVTWQTTIMPLRVLGSSGDTRDPYAIVHAIEYAMNAGASVISLSFVGTVENDLLKIAIKRAYDAGVLVVAAAGNAPTGGTAIDLGKDPRYPVCLDQGGENFVLGVAATTETDRKAEFSNFGSCIDVSAPGVRFLATQHLDPSNRDFQQLYGGYYNGTSLAAPVVAGVAALMKAVDPALTPKRLIELIRATAVPLASIDPQYAGGLGEGRIDANRAVDAALAERDLREGAGDIIPTTALVPPGEGRLIIAGAGPGRAPEIRMFTPSGLFVRSFLAFPTSFHGGVSVAAGNFNGGLRHTIVAGALAGGAPQIRIFSQDGRIIGGFNAFDAGFRGGVRVATGDLDGDGKDEVVAAAGPGGGPHVRIFSSNGQSLGGFFAFDPAYRGGVSVATGDLDGDGKDEIVASTLGHAATVVRMFDAKGNVHAEFQPFGPKDRSGASVTVADVDGDSTNDIIVTGKGEVSVWSKAGQRLGRISGDAFIRDRTPAHAGRANAPFVLPAQNGSRVTAFAFNGVSVSFLAFDAKYRGTVNATTLSLLR